MTAILAALAVAVLLLPPAAAGRLREVVPRQAPSDRQPRHERAGPTTAGRQRAGPRPRTTTPGRRGAGGVLGLVGPADLACLLGGVAVALVIGGVPGLLLGALLALGAPPALRRLEPAAQRREREEVERDLPLALDLLAACLAGGAPLPAAAGVVATALPGACGARLARVAGALAVGSAPADAWAELAAAGGGTRGEAVVGPHARTNPGAPGVAEPAARALARAGDGGAPVAAVVARLAADAREQSRAQAEQRARGAGVLAVLPLGLCFLPAFVLLGVVPVLVGLLAPLLEGL